MFPGEHFLFTCSDTFALISCRHNALCHRHTQTDRQTDVIMMTIADHTTWQYDRLKQLLRTHTQTDRRHYDDNSRSYYVAVRSAKTTTA